MRECVEYFWNEQRQDSYTHQLGVGEFTYEDQRTGELTVEYKAQPLLAPEITEETRAGYFSNLVFWLKTQPLYD